MSDAEFDILDELYFVTSFHDLLENVDFDQMELVPLLKSLYDKGLIKVLSTHDDEVAQEALDFEKDHQSYFFWPLKEVF